MTDPLFWPPGPGDDLAADSERLRGWRRCSPRVRARAHARMADDAREVLRRAFIEASRGILEGEEEAR